MFSDSYLGPTRKTKDNALGKKPGNIRDAVRAKRTRRLPVVLTRQEVLRLFEQMTFAYILKA
jgi:hypothetical protein